MPVDLEMILSASPPLFTHSAFADFRYGTCTARNRLLNAVNGAYVKHRQAGPLVNVPTRPCLIIKDAEVTLSTEDGAVSPTSRHKKRVWFADDRGLALTHVRVMTEPSDCPPRWTDDFLEHVTQGIKPQIIQETRWETTFVQPASDYLAFRNKLEKKCVSLENVIVKDMDEIVTGTIKVKNLSFEKEVFIRLSFDQWKSHQDVAAKFVPSGIEGAPTPYDTFAFTASIPSSAAKNKAVEFCVCYRSKAGEFWDNNDGANYKLVTANKDKSRVQETKRFADAVTAEFEKWAEFASWNHLINDSPYW